MCARCCSCSPTPAVRTSWSANRSPDIALRTKGLDKRRQDNVIIVGPTAELASREKAELAARKEVAELSPVRTEFMQVNYAKVADLLKLIKPQGGGGAGASNSMLSPRGSIS